MNVAILVLSVDEAERLEGSLPAAAAQGAGELVVVANGCTDASAAVAAAHGARVVTLAERRSYAAALNAGLAALGAAADAVLFLNADCVLGEGALARLVAALGDPGVGSVAPKLLRAHGMAPADRLDRIDAAGMTVDRRRKNRLLGHDAPARAYARPGPAFGADGACALWRRATLEDCAVAGEVIDEDLALWASDVDLAWRAQLLGWRAAYEPAAVGWHVRFYSPSTRRALAAEHRRLQFRNRLLMMAKNDGLADLLRDAHHVVAYEVLALGYALVVERDLLGAYRDAWRALPAARRRRRAIQARRRTRPPFGLTPSAGSAPGT